MLQQVKIEVLQFLRSTPKSKSVVEELSFDSRNIGSHMSWKVSFPNLQTSAAVMGFHKYTQKKSDENTVKYSKSEKKIYIFMNFPELIPFTRPLQTGRSWHSGNCICSFWEKKNSSLANGARNPEN